MRLIDSFHFHRSSDFHALEQSTTLHRNGRKAQLGRGYRERKKSEEGGMEGGRREGEKGQGGRERERARQRDRER